MVRAAAFLLRQLGDDLLGTPQWQAAPDGDFRRALARFVALGRWLLGHMQRGELSQRWASALGDAFVRIVTHAFRSGEGSTALQRAHYDIDLRADCLWCIALMPRGVELQLRNKALHNALRDRAPELRALALNMLPLLLTAHGDERDGDERAAAASTLQVLRDFAPTLRALASGAPEVALSLAALAGTIACAACSASRARACA